MLLVKRAAQHAEMTRALLGLARMRGDRPLSRNAPGVKPLLSEQVAHDLKAEVERDNVPHSSEHEWFSSGHCFHGLDSRGRFSEAPKASLRSSARGFEATVGEEVGRTAGRA